MGRPYRPRRIWITGPMCMVAAAIVGCAGLAASGGDSPVDCLEVGRNRLEQAPVWDCLPTLDGQCVPLAAFFEACDARWPNCVLYSKFYHWESEVRTIISNTPRGPVSHRVRLYHNILHSCRPNDRDALRTHGDVAEFYDETGSFMGLAVYMGQGLYCPLPAPGRTLMPNTL